MTSDDEELEEAQSYAQYSWECPHCDQENDTSDIDVAGTISECWFCDKRVKII